MSLALKDLQRRINEIAGEVGGLDTNAKLDWAKAKASQDEELYGLFLEVVNEALVRRWNRDVKASLNNFLEEAE